MLERGEKESPKFHKLVAEAEIKREARKGKFFEHTKETLRLLLPEAEKRGLKLGCENREAVQEIPVGRRFQIVLPRTGTARAWILLARHRSRADQGENLGLIRHAMHLNRSPTGSPDFTFTTCRFPRATIARPVQA